MYLHSSEFKVTYAISDAFNRCVAKPPALLSLSHCHRLTGRICNNKHLFVWKRCSVSHSTNHPTILSVIFSECLFVYFNYTNVSLVKIHVFLLHYVTCVVYKTLCMGCSAEDVEVQ